MLFCFQTAQRILKNTCPEVKAQFYGYAPAGFYKYKYPKNVQEKNGSVGAKVKYMVLLLF